MLIVGLNFLIGVVCGLRLTLTPFIFVMMVALGGIFFASEPGAGFLAMFGRLALSATFQQFGYVAGLVVRAYADVASPRFSSKAPTPGSLPRKAR